MNRRILLKRVLAYLTDLCVVMLLVSLLSRVPILNPSMDSYQKEYKSFTEVVEKYQEKKITKKEYEKEYNKMYYKIQKYSVPANIINVILILLYFGVFQNITKGQTIGKKLMKFQVVDQSGKDAKWYQYLVRSIFLYSFLYYILLSCGTFIFSVPAYSTYSSIVYYLNMMLEVAIFYLLYTREDQRGLHDIIAGTKVVYLGEEKEEIKDAEIIEEKAQTKKTTKSVKKKKEN